MKTKLLSLACAVISLVSIPAALASATAWTQIGFTVEVDSGTLNVEPAGSYLEAAAHWHDPSVPLQVADGNASSFLTASASAGPSTAVGLDVFDDVSYFLFDAFATTALVPGASGGASATVLAAYNLSVSGATGPTVTFTLTPVFYNNELTSHQGSFGYTSAFLSLGTESFFAFQDSNDSSGLATPAASYTLTVNAGETVALTGLVTAGVQVPDASATLGLMAMGLAFVLGLKRLSNVRLLRG